MKIKDIRTIALSYKCEPPYASASGVQARRGALLVEVETDDGTVGIGEAGPGGGVTATCLEKDLKPLLIGEDPLMI
jgi:L-alanine-DL-glutamate epimerase-like enolase superfamily enzyme